MGSMYLIQVCISSFCGRQPLLILVLLRSMRAMGLMMGARVVVSAPCMCAPALHRGFHVRVAYLYPVRRWQPTKSDGPETVAITVVDYGDEIHNVKGAP